MQFTNGTVLNVVFLIISIVHCTDWRLVGVGDRDIATEILY